MCTPWYDLSSNFGKLPKRKIIESKRGWSFNPTKKETVAKKHHSKHRRIKRKKR